MKLQYFLITLFVCVVFFLPALINPNFLTSRDNDLGRTYIPLFSFIRDSFFTYKEIPLWRSEQLMGESLVGNPLSSLFYLGNFFFLIFPVNWAATIYLISHIFIAALFTFLLARSFSLSPFSSLAAALFYAFSTKMLLHIAAGHLTMVAAFSYFPLSFLALRKIITSGDFHWIAVGALSYSLIYIVYPTIFYYAIIFLLIYFVYKVFSKKAKQTTSVTLLIRQKVVPLVLMLIVTSGLLAVVLLPHLEFAPLSTRSQLKLEDVALPLWNLRRFATSLTFPYINFGSFDHESLIYLGLIPSILATIGFTKLPANKKIFLAIVGILTLLFTAGLSTPLFELFYKYLPFLKYTRITTRLWFAVSLVVALLGAYALEKMKPKRLIYLLLVIFLAESFYVGHKKITATPYLSFKNDQLYQYLANDHDLFRVYCTTYCFNPQLISKYKIQVLHGESPIQDAKFVKFLESAGNYRHAQFAVIFPPYQVWQVNNPSQPNAMLLGLANVKYVVSSYHLSSDEFNLIQKFGNFYLYKNDFFKPRVYFEGSDQKVSIEKYSPNRIIVTFKKSLSPQVLIFSEKFYPDWYASVNNQKFKVEPYLSVFRKVVIPGNTDRIELKYEPQSFKTGKIITLATIFVLLMYFWYSLKKNKKWLKLRF